MLNWSGFGKLFIVAGAILVLLGGMMLLFGRLPGAGSEGNWLNWLGKLPGDIDIKRDGFRFYAPLATCLLISLALNLIYYLISSLLKR